ncbi:hypothetical protein KI387_037064, partial [Taxus chinensis]
SEPEEFIGGETEEEIEDMEISELGEEEDINPKWHDSQEILQAERVEQSVEMETLVSEELTAQDL